MTKGKHTIHVGTIHAGSFPTIHHVLQAQREYAEGWAEKYGKEPIKVEYRPLVEGDQLYLVKHSRKTGRRVAWSKAEGEAWTITTVVRTNSNGAVR